jgi:hypothetical protein
MENCVALSQDFFNFFLFWHCVCKNVKNKPYFSMLDGIPVVSAIFPTRKDMGSKPMLWSKMFAQNIGDE